MSGWSWEFRGPQDRAVDIAAAMRAFRWHHDVHQVERLPVRGCELKSRSAGDAVLGDLFRVTRSGAAEQLVLGGTSSLIDGVGCGWQGGELIVEGCAGDEVSREQVGGFVWVHGACGSRAATAMRGGMLRIDGDVGSGVGGPAIGRGPGMRGGRVWIRGTAGPRLGERLRRGTILVEGDCETECGLQMIAGTVVVLGQIGADAGQLMRRGSLIVRAAKAAVAPLPLPSWSEPQSVDLLFLRLLWRDLATWGTALQFLRDWPTTGRRQIGDRSCGGIAEYLCID